jgi:hypothetical protein
MAETSFFWTGASVGDHGAYTDDQFSDIFRSLFTAGPTVQGVIAGYAGMLAVSNPSGNTIRLASGLAMVDGKVYENTADLDIDILSTSFSNNRYDLVVLRKSWSAQTVRLAIVTGAEAASPTVPTVTQIDGTTWEIALAKIYITSASVITLTDLREYARFASPLVYRRQGSAAGWTAPGVINYIPAITFIQAGSAQISLLGDPDGTKTVTFPVAFSQVPLVLVTCDAHNYVVTASDISTSLFLIMVEHRAGALATIDIKISWLAVGEIE